MEHAGFVLRKPDATDRRVSRVYLTKKGRAIRSRVQKIWQTMEQETLEGFTSEERVVVRRLLLRIQENLLRATGKIIEE